MLTSISFFKFVVIFIYFFFFQPAGFNKGNLVVSLSWISTAKRLEIKVGQASNLKSPHGVDGKGKA